MTDPAKLAPSEEDQKQLSSLRSEQAQIDATRADIAQRVAEFRCLDYADG